MNCLEVTSCQEQKTYTNASVEELIILTGHEFFENNITFSFSG